MSSASDNPQVHHGAYGLCRDPANRLLLVHMASGPDKGRWTMPGGGIEWGEHPDAAVLREMEEETGIAKISSYRVCAMYSHMYPRTAERPYDSIHHIGILYEITLDRFDLRPEKDGTTDRCAWFAEEEARRLPLTPLGEFAVNWAWPKT